MDVSSTIPTISSSLDNLNTNNNDTSLSTNQQNVIDNPTSIDCIDLNDNEYESITTYRSVSPTCSLRTVSEFEAPDNKGHAKVKGTNNRSVIGQIQTVVGSVIGKFFSPPISVGY